uniref:Uncharacterized protein n=1 Tax=Steinernema glaseri TaxID=37863 RepID=A0A1I7ZZX0_9BILA
MGNEAVGNGAVSPSLLAQVHRLQMPALPSPLAQLQAEYARRLAEKSPMFRPLATERPSMGGLHAKKSEYLFEGTIGRAAVDDLATGLEASEMESLGRVPSLTDSGVFGFSDVKTSASASQVSICLPSQRPSDYSCEEPMNIFAWNRHTSEAARAPTVNTSVYCFNDLNDTALRYADTTACRQ